MPLYSSSLANLLPQQQSLLERKMSFLDVIVCFLGQCAHKKSFVKALLNIQCIHNEMCMFAVHLDSPVR